MPQAPLGVDHSANGKTTAHCATKQLRDNEEVSEKTPVYIQIMMVSPTDPTLIKESSQIHIQCHRAAVRHQANDDAICYKSGTQEVRARLLIA